MNNIIEPGSKEGLLQAAEHIRSCNEAQAESDRLEKELRMHNAQLHEYIAHEIRLAMQQEKLDDLNGITRAAVADIRASMIMQAITFDIRGSHVTTIPSDHIERKTKQLIG